MPTKRQREQQEINLILGQLSQTIYACVRLLSGEPQIWPPAIRPEPYFPLYTARPIC